MKNYWIEEEKREANKRHAKVAKKLEQIWDCYGSGIWDWQQNAYAIYMEDVKNKSLTCSEL